MNMIRCRDVKSLLFFDEMRQGQKLLYTRAGSLVLRRVKASHRHRSDVSPIRRARVHFKLINDGPLIVTDQRAKEYTALFVLNCKSL